MCNENLKIMNDIYTTYESNSLENLVVVQNNGQGGKLHVRTYAKFKSHILILKIISQHIH